MRDPDPWHYHRKDLTRLHLDRLESRLAHAVVLFGPRRTGKTEFLLQDLGPGAQALGWKVAYGNFWQSRLSPLAVLFHTLATANRRGSVAERTQALAADLKPKLKLGGAAPGSPLKAEAEIDLSQLGGPPSTDLLLRLDDLFDRFAPRNKRALLMLDEVQELAEGDNGALIAALRTSADKRKDHLAIFFTGSSQDKLRAMFSRRNAPFFHFGSQVEWPPFDDGFVTHSLAAFAKIVRAKLDRDACVEAFVALDRNPYYFRKLLEALAFDPARDVAAALTRVRERAAEDLRYPDTWLALSPLQQAVAVMLAAGDEKPFSKQASAVIARRTHSQAPTRAQILAAVRALMRADIVSKGAGAKLYEFDDPQFARWILARAA